MRLSGILLAAIVFLSVASGSAMAANVVGANCAAMLGTTQLSDDKTGIIGCFLVTGTTGTAPPCATTPGVPNGNCKWRSMTTTTTSTAIYGGFGGIYWVNRFPSPSCLASNPFTGNCSCPSGYTARLIPGVAVPIHEEYYCYAT